MAAHTYLLMNLFYSIFLLFFCNTLHAQKYDVNWVLGDAYFDQYLFSFENVSPSINILQYNQFSNLGANITMSNQYGQVLFFTNGCKVYSLSNPSFSNSINQNEYFCTFQSSSGWPYGGISLPIPSSQTQYLIINYETAIGSPLQTYDCFQRKFIYQIIEINEDVPATYNILTQDGVMKEGCLQKVAACKHANGRDWWLIAGDNLSSQFYRWLLTPSGLEEQEPQLINNPSISADSTSGGFHPTDNTFFSPDGTKYLISTSRAGTIYFGFDRCTGLLSNPQKIYTSASVAQFGAIFSPNSRYIYLVDNGTTIYQFDTDAPDIAATKTVVAEWDGYIDPVYGNANGFSGIQLGYDGRMYLFTGSLFGHSIAYPNRKGEYCTFQQRIFTTPAPTSAGKLFSYPHYRLGPIDGTTCDSLGINNEPSAIFRYAVDDTLSPLVVSFTDASVYEPTAWHWDFGDGTTSTETNPVHTFTTPGTYTVCLVVSNAYAADTLCRTVQLGTSGLLDLPILPIAQVTPNPVTTTLRVRLPAQVGNYVPRFRVIDVWGRVVQDLALTGFDHELDMGTAPAGIYLWQLLWGDRMGQSGRVVKVAGE
jgi:PKD repeat protein